MSDPDPDPGTVGRYVARLEIALQSGFFDLAHRIISELEQSATSAPDPITLSTSLAEIDALPVRVVNLLSAAGIHTIGDCLQRTPAELATIPSIGPSSVRSIITTLRSLPILCYRRSSWEVLDDRRFV